jgi:hypothetical protein
MHTYKHTYIHTCDDATLLDEDSEEMHNIHIHTYIHAQAPIAADDDANELDEESEEMHNIHIHTYIHTYTHTHI